MIRILGARLLQKHRTMKYPDGPVPELSDRYLGRPQIEGTCLSGCTACLDACPVNAIIIKNENVSVDTGRCQIGRAHV